MRKVLSLTLLLILSINSFAWRIEGNKLIIEEGDNLWNISHNLLAKGIDYKIIWDYNKEKYKHLTTNPSLIYDGMELNIPDSLIPFLTTNSNCCPNDSLGVVIKHLASIENNVKNINNRQVISGESVGKEKRKERIWNLVITLLATLITYVVTKFFSGKKIKIGKWIYSFND